MTEDRRISLDEQTSKGLLDNLLAGIFILVDEHILWANQPLLGMLDFKLEELAAEPAWRIVHPDDRDRVQQVARERVAGMREGEVYETRLVRKDGSTLWAEIRATPITFHDVPAVLTSAVEITDRKRAEQALAESEARFRAFFENAPIGIYRTSPDGRVLLANPALLRMLGFESLAEAQKRDLDREGFEPTYPRSEFKQRMDRDGHVLGLESAWIRADDSLLYVRENAQAVSDDSGRVLYYEGTVEDITRQKQASQSLALFAQRLQVKQEVDQAILSARSPEEIVRAVVTRIRRLVPCQRATVLLLDVDHDRARVFATAAAEDYQGGIREGSDLPLDQVLRPAIREQPDRNHYVPDIDAMEVVPGALEHLRAMGIRSCLTVPLVTDGVLAGTLNLAAAAADAFDAEQQKIATALGDQLSIALHQAQLRSQLAEERERLKTLLEHLPEGVLMLDGDHRVVLSNPTAREYLAALTPATASELPDQLGCMALAQRLGERDFELTTASEPARTFELSCRPVPAGQSVGQSAEPSAGTGWAIVIREVTEDRQIQRQLRQQERQAAIGSLASGVAHDFNNLISAISGCAWILLRKLPADNELRKPADDIRATCDRASQLSRQLLQFSRSRTGEPQRLNLNGVVSDMGRMLGRLVGSSIELKLELSRELSAIMADPVGLEQVLVNLVVNARDAMHRGGTLIIETLDLQVHEPDGAWPGGLDPGHYVLLRISDTGAGMDEATLAQAFDPFFTTRTAEGGTGLGLSTVKGLVAEAAGLIRVRSELGRGTTLELAFPTLV